jgi:hypothetical protein
MPRRQAIDAAADAFGLLVLTSLIFVGTASAVLALAITTTLLW